MSKRRARRIYRNRKSLERLLLFAQTCRLKDLWKSNPVDVFRVARAFSEYVRQAALGAGCLSMPSLLLTVNPSSYAGARSAGIRSVTYVDKTSRDINGNLITNSEGDPIDVEFERVRLEFYGDNKGSR